MSTKDKRNWLTQYETDWILDGASASDIFDLMMGGWIGYANMTDDQIDEYYDQRMKELS